MKTITLEQAKKNTATIRQSIEQAERIREEKRDVCGCLRQEWKAADVGTDAWTLRHDRLNAIIDQLSEAFDKSIMQANAMIADMANMQIITDELKVKYAVDSDNAKIVSTSTAELVDAIAISITPRLKKLASKRKQGVA